MILQSCTSSPFNRRKQPIYGSEYAISQQSQPPPDLYLAARSPSATLILIFTRRTDNLFYPHRPLTLRAGFPAQEKERGTPHGRPFLRMKKHFYENIDYFSASAAIFRIPMTYSSLASFDMSIRVLLQRFFSSLDKNSPLFLHRSSRRLATVDFMASPVCSL